MDAPVARIVAAVRSTLDRCPPELSGDLVTRGIVLTGGGALLRGLDARLQHEIGIPVLVADRPLDSVVLGTGTVVEHFEQLHKVVVDGPAAVSSFGAAAHRQRQRLAAIVLAVIALVSSPWTSPAAACGRRTAAPVGARLAVSRHRRRARPGAALHPGRARRRQEPRRYRRRCSATTPRCASQLAADSADAATRAELAKLKPGSRQGRITVVPARVIGNRAPCRASTGR